MGGTAAMNLAAWHRNQFKQATSLSGYLNPTWPGMYAGIQYAMNDAAKGANIWDMWGSPVDPRRFRNDPTVQAGRFSGMPLYLAASGGVPSRGEKFLENPRGVAAGIGLEWMARTSTAKFEMAARAVGARPVVSYPMTGLHAWPYWDAELSKARPHILRALGA